MWCLPFALAALQVLAPPSALRRSGVLQSPRLRESSGVAVSRAHRGVLWTHNDSGDGPYIYATDTSGADRGALRVPGANAVDWEDMTLGPCPASPASCLYLADTGDNDERRVSVTVYAVPEPPPPGGPADTAGTTGAPAVLHMAYPGGPADVEAVYVMQDASLYLVTKGRSRGIRLYRVPRQAWAAGGVVTAELVGELPITPDWRLGRWVTGAAASPDGAQVVVRTYTEIYMFPVAAGRLAPTPTTCVLGPLEYQGEAVAFLNGEDLVLTSEAGPQSGGTIHIARCP